MADKIDARTLWLPVSATVGVIAIVFVAGMAYESVSSDAGSANQSVAELNATLNVMRTELGEIRGSLQTLMQMQSAVAETKADIKGITSRMNSFDTRLQAMDAWIQTTRERLNRQGFDAPPYEPED